MKAIRQFISGAIVCLLELAVGILLLIDPTGFTASILIIGGIILMIWGIMRIIRYFTAEPDAAIAHDGLFCGLCLLLAGGFCAFRSEWLVTLLPMIVLLYGIALLVAGLRKIQWAANMFRFKKGRWPVAAFSAAISMVCGSMIIRNPFQTTTMLWTFIGISLMIESVIDVITFLSSGTTSRQSSLNDKTE